jgi:hypothetical protein
MYKHEYKYLYKYGPNEQKILGDANTTQQPYTITLFNDSDETIRFGFMNSREEEEIRCYPRVLIIDPGETKTYSLGHNTCSFIDKIVIINCLHRPSGPRNAMFYVAPLPERDSSNAISALRALRETFRYETFTDHCT